MSKLRRLLWPLASCLILFYPAYFLEDLLHEMQAHASAQTIWLFRHTLEVAVWLSSAWLLNEFLHVAAWSRISRPVPTILKHIVSILIFGFALTGIFGYVFDQSVTGIWATSGVFGLVIGFAARSLIADLFCGIALHLDPPFRIGDWIEWKEGTEVMLARVEQINWRSTRVHARDDTKTLFIPNSHLSTVAITNVFAPLGRTRQFVRIPLDPDVDLARATRILLAGALTAEGPLPDPAPDVLLDSVAPEGLVFHVRYWHDPETSFTRVRSSVLYSILANLEHAGIKTSSIRHEIRTIPLPPCLPPIKDVCWILRSVEIFQSFEDEELDAISKRTIRHEFQEKSSIVRQGEPGDSLYFVLEGLLDVMIEQPGKPPLRVNRLAQGQYFGEMSLLTGDLRSATVTAATSTIVYEVAKKVLEPILAARPEVVRQLARTVARRQIQNQATFALDSTPDALASQQSFTEQILAKIHSFFASTPTS